MLHENTRGKIRMLDAAGQQELLELFDPEVREEACLGGGGGGGAAGWHVLGCIQAPSSGM